MYGWDDQGGEAGSSVYEDYMVQSKRCMAVRICKSCKHSVLDGNFSL